MNPVVENAGDLTHRMAQNPAFFKGGFEWVKAKVDNLHRHLNEPYGFEREFEENVRSNASYNKVDVRKFKQELDNALEAYANEHSKLKVYNDAQKTARDLAIAVGRKNWDEARALTAKLKSVTDQGLEAWERYATEFTPPEIDFKDVARQLKTLKRRFK